MKKVLVCLIILAGVFFCTKSFSQIFIKAVGNTGMASPAIGTFDGGSTAEGHANEIEAFAYSDGLAGCSNINAGGGGGACKVSKSPFTFSMPLSFAVNSFKYNLLTGRLITTVDMVLRKSGGNEGPHGGPEYYKVHMEGVLVSSITEGAKSPDAPEFNIELLPQRIAWQIIKQNNDGNLGAKFNLGWDFAKNKAFNYAFPTGGGGLGVTAD